MKFETMKQAIQFRITKDRDTYWEDDYFEAAVEIFTNNINKTIKYFKDECTDEEFFWASEVFERIAAKTQSLKLIAVWRARLAAVSAETYNQADFQSELMREWVDYKEYVRSVGDEIEFADGQIFLLTDYKEQCISPVNEAESGVSQEQEENRK